MRNTYRALSAPNDANPITAPAGYYMLPASFQEADGHKVWIQEFVKGAGVIFIKNSIVEGGLMEHTEHSLSAYNAQPGSLPYGIIVHKSAQEEQGYRVWIIVALQSPSGGDPTGGILQSYSDWMQFEYPGRAKAYTKSRQYPGVELIFLDVFMSPAVRTEVEGTVEVSYQLGGASATLPHELWQPKAWATLEASYIRADDDGVMLVEGLSGFRSVSDTELSATGSGFGGTNVVCMGHQVFHGNTAYLKVVGGPVDPVGNTYVLLKDLKPAFMSYDGIQYYRRTVGYATIPSQPALPV